MSTEIVDIRTPRGNPARFSVRKGTSDLSVLGSVYADVVGSPLIDEYRLRDMTVEGRFLDIGAHIGAVGIAVLLDNPEAFAVFVEPLPENIDAIKDNLALNGLTDRAEVIQAAVGTDTVHYNHADSDMAVTNRFIGNLNIGADEGTTIKVRRVTLRDLLPAVVMKIDCEGGEWSVFADKRVKTIPYVFGEYHSGRGREGVRAAFDDTHIVTIDGDDMLGLFSAVQR